MGTLIFMIYVVIAALLALGAAWLINIIIGAMMGEKPGGLFRDWFDIFSHVGSSPASYAEPLPGLLKTRKFSVGDKVRVQLIPIDLERNMSPERRELFRRCAGKVLRVENVDEFGVLELHVLDDGSQSPDRAHHILFIEPQYVEPVIQDI